MSDDGSITAEAIISINKLVDRLDQSDDPNAREAGRRLRDAMAHPDRRVGTAFRLKPRGGRAPSVTQRLEERNGALCQFTALQPGIGQNARIKQARQKLDRYAANGWPHERDKAEDTGNRERDLMRQIMKTGLLVPGQRQHRAIVSARAEK